MACSTDHGVQDAIAIVGMSCRLSGIATSPEGLWKMLSKGLTGWTSGGSSRFSPEAFWHPQHDLSGSFNTRGFHLLTQDPALFDSAFFGISNVEAKAIDPQHRMMLEVAYEAFEDAGLRLEDLAGSDTAVFCAVSHHDYERILGRDPEVSPGYRFTGTGPSMLANRVSYVFDLRGPSMTLDTACSSGLVALHQACMSIRAGEVKQALVGGANLILDPDQATVMSSMSFLSPHGRCYSFDSRADGFGRGEGVAAVMLKPLAQALRDGDAIRAVISGSSVVQDGSTPGITMPSCEAQTRMINKVYEQAGLHPKDTVYVEAHGTGTTAGDKIEATALRDTFCNGGERTNPLFIGSIKANVGHTESVAGLAGVIKSVLMIEKGLIPPNPTFTKPSESIPLDSWGLKVPTQMIPWPEDTIRRASINSFGYGGTNAHVIIDAAPAHLRHGTISSIEDSPNTLEPTTSRPRLFILSHALESGVREAAANLRRFASSLEDNEQSLDSLAFTLSRRSVFDYKMFVTASSKQKLLEELDHEHASQDRIPSNAKAPKICFAFTGQGAQWAGMACELLETNPVFAQSMKQFEETLLRLGADWCLIEELRKQEGSRINEAVLSQPVCTAVQLALVDMLQAWNIVPAGVVGHSSGEIAAAYAAGMITAEDALAAAYHRGMSVKKLRELHPHLRGAMLAAGISAADARLYLVDEPKIGKAVVACENSPHSVTISGDDEAVSAVQERLAADQLFNRKLVVEAAYHSHHMELVEQPYWNAIQHLQCGQRRRETYMVSSVYAEEVEDGALDASYWCKNLTSPVRFSDALPKVLKAIRGKDQDPIVIVEIGPHSALAGPIKQILKGSNLQGINYLSVLLRKQDASSTALATVGKLFQHGCAGLNFDAINDPCGKAKKSIISDLPKYSWTHKTRHWSESRRSANYRLRRFPRHDLLGTACMDSIAEEPTWRNYLRLSEQPWIVGHSISGSIVFPAAGYLAMALEALKQATLNDGKPWKNLRVKFQNVKFGSALIIPEDSAAETVFLLRPHASKDSWKEFRVYSISTTGESTEHCRGMATVASQSGRQRDLTDAESASFIDAATNQSETRIESRKLYEDLRAAGLDYTGLFAGNKEIRASKSRSSYYISIPDSQSTMPSKHQQSHCIHPATLDLCFQSAFPSMKVAGLLGSSLVVASVNSLEIHTEIPSKLGQELQVTAKLDHYGRSKVITDTVVARPRSGKPSVVMKINGLVLASSGGPLWTRPSQRPEGESLTHRLKWSIDPDLAEPSTITKYCQLEKSELESSGPNSICEEYARMIINETLSSIGLLEKKLKINGHFSKLLEWMQAINKTNTAITTTTTAESLESQVKAAGAHGEMLVHIRPHLVDVLRGDLEPLALLQEQNRLYGMYNYENYDRGHRQLVNYVKLLQFKNPNMRILEIGAGTASTTTPVMEALSETADALGRPKLSSYTFTDISTGFFDKAEERLSKYGELVEFKKLDIEHPPEQQGIEVGSYDLVIATNVLHATHNVGNTLHNVRSLLKPGGSLALLEFTVTTVHTGLIFGMLPGWWLSDDGRQGGPLQSASAWDDRLRKCGFTGVDVELPDYANNEKELSLLISTAGQERLNHHSTGRYPRNFSISSNPSTADGSEFDSERIVHIVLNKTEERVADHLTELLRRVRIPAKKVDLSGQVAPGQPVVVLLESAGPFLSRCTESEWEVVRNICRVSGEVLWITAGAAMESSNPMRSLITGLSRCLRSEDHSIKFVTLDLEAKSDLESTLDWELSASRQIHTIFQHSFHRTGRASLMEWEYAIRNGEVLIPRLIEDTKMDTYIQDHVSNYHPRQEKALQSDRALGLNIQSPGLLDTLYWEDCERHSSPVGPDEVRVKLQYISLNFKDVMIAMGQLDGHTTLLLEGTGEVVAVGDRAADQFSIGDSVYVLDFDGVATTSNVHKSNVHHIPSDVSLDIPAAIGIAYATAYYALVNRGSLHAGESVLIHSGAGAVGQAAITLAKEVCKAGEIFVTAGSDEKREFIKSKFGIPDENIFSSRGLGFYQAILDRTAGEGVDVVLNSLSGEALQKSVELLAPLGRFVEIGKKDLLSSESRLDMRPLEKNIQFSTVDLTLVGRRQPAQLRAVYSAIFELLSQKKIAIISPIAAKSISQTEEAFRLMQTGQHMGKLLLSLDSEASIPVQPPKPQSVALNADSSYLVVGGTGGLGKATLRLLAKLGAKRIVTISRTGLDSQSTKELVDEMAAKGVEVSVHKGSVLDKALLKALSEQYREHPVRGVIQGAMVLQDSRVEEMGYEQWRTATDPKVYGTWNIHEVFGNSLDFFVLLSSSGGIIGSFSQGNYCAGNTFQDAFARYRAGLRLPGRSINIGFVEGAGYTAENQAAAEFVTRQGLSSYRLEEFLVTVEEAIRNPLAATPIEAQLLCGISRAEPGSQTKEAAIQRPDPKFSHIWKRAAVQEQRTTTSGQVDVHTVLRSCTSADEASETTLHAIKTKLARLLAVPPEDIRTDRSVASHGMDSLVAVELRNWTTTFLEAQVQTFELMSSMSFSDLALMIAKRSHLIAPGVFAET
ncbi:polyketide synthase [Xylariales sp. PMI_506]|nr:polyketide synthase [Xylariales sp. PMI_506]